MVSFSTPEGLTQAAEAWHFDIDDGIRYLLSTLKPSRGGVDEVGFGCESTSHHCLLSVVPGRI
jgi:hypothetical protein